MTRPFAPNVELFVDVLARIERSPDNWNQSSWMDFVKVSNGRVDICASAGCFAGWACLIAGEGHPTLPAYAVTEVVNDGGSGASQWRTPDGELVDIDGYAYQLLGIENPYELDTTDEEEDAVMELFSGYNNLAKLYELSAVICRLDEAALRERAQARAAELAALDIKALPRPVNEEGELINV